MFRELCGDTTLQNVILVTNMWGEVVREVGEAREKELTTNFFKPVLDKGARLTRNYNTVNSAYSIIRSIMENVPIPLQIQRELVDEGRDIIDTAAGETISKQLGEQIRQYQEEIKAVQEDMVQALKEKDEETRHELEEEMCKLREQVNRMRMNSESMASNYHGGKRGMQEVIREVQEQARKEREQTEAAYRKQMDDLIRRLEGVANTSAADREVMQQQINHLQESANASAAEREAMERRIDQLQHQRGNGPRSSGEKVMNLPVQVPPKFVFDTGFSSSSPDFNPPLGSESVYCHPKYYMDTDMVVFQVGTQIGVLASVADLAAV